VTSNSKRKAGRKAASSSRKTPGRRIILSLACSLDGFIARRDGGVDWLFTDGDYGMSEFYRSIDTVLIGRKTHDVMRGFGQASYKGKKNYVFSRAPSPEGSDAIEYVSGEVRPFVESLRQTKGKNIWLVGGTELAEAFLREGLIDEIMLAIHPIILGDGIPLFRTPRPTVELALESFRAYPKGLVMLHYRVK